MKNNYKNFKNQLENYQIILIIILIIKFFKINYYFFFFKKKRKEKKEKKKGFKAEKMRTLQGQNQKTLVK